MKFHMVRVFGQGVNPAKAYRVESTEMMSEIDALQLLRDLDSPYHGQRYPNRPTATGTDVHRLEDKRTDAPITSAEEQHWVEQARTPFELNAVNEFRQRAVDDRTANELDLNARRHPNQQYNSETQTVRCAAHPRGCYKPPPSPPDTRADLRRGGVWG